MASIRFRSGKWQVQIRLKRGPQVSRSFNLKADAISWARNTESDIQAGRYKALNCPQTLRELLERYLREITPKKRSKRQETSRINVMLKEHFMHMKVGDITPAVLNQYRDKRLLEAQAQAVRHDLNLLGHIFKTAKLEWGYELENPVDQIRKPSQPPARTRRLRIEELKRLMLEVKKRPNKAFHAFVLLAIETGMRKGEILKLTKSNIDLERGEAYLGMTKNGLARMVPLSPLAKQIVEELIESSATTRLVSICVSTLERNWRLALKAASIQDFHIHDLRREAVSRFFEHGFSIPEVASISGHKDWRMVQRYVKLNTSQLVKKLAQIQYAG